MVFKIKLMAIFFSEGNSYENFKKSIENEINRTRDVLQCKLKRDIGMISKENLSKPIILKV